MIWDIIWYGKFKNGAKLTHKDHVELGWTLLMEDPVNAERAMESIIEDYAEVNNVPNPFDLGTTRRWLGRISRAMIMVPRQVSFEEFWNANKQLHLSDAKRRESRGCKP